MPHSRTDHLLNRLRMRQLALLIAIDELRTLPAARSMSGEIIPQPGAQRIARHSVLRNLPYAFSQRSRSGGSLVRRGQRINPVMRRFLDLIHAKASTDRRRPLPPSPLLAEHSDRPGRKAWTSKPDGA